MNVWEFGHTLRRQWWLVVCGVLVTAGVAVWVGRPDTVYLVNMRVQLIAPATPYTTGPPTNAFASANSALVAMAGLVRSTVVTTPPPYKLNDSTITIVDEDRVPGEKVFVPDTGWQWSTDWSTPAVQIQVSGRDEGVVRARADALREEVAQALTHWQDRLAVPAESRVTSQVANPDTAMVVAHNSPRLAMVLAVLTGLGATVFVTTWVDSVRADRRRLRRNASLLTRPCGRLSRPRDPQLQLAPASRTP